MCHFFSDRLSVPIAGALVSATRADPAQYSDHLSLAVLLLVRSQSANALANSVYRKTSASRHFSRQPPSLRNIRLRARELLASLTPLVVAAFEATRMVPPATLDGLPVMPHSLAVARILCARDVHGRSQYRRASSTGSGWRLLYIILGAGEVRVEAAAAGSGAQGAWRSTSCCHRGCCCCRPAARGLCCSA